MLSRFPDDATLYSEATRGEKFNGNTEETTDAIRREKRRRTESPVAATEDRKEGDSCYVRDRVEDAEEVRDI